jgi:hypothetical protein
VKHKKPPGDLSNLVLFSLAGVGVAALIGAGVSWWGGQRETPAVAPVVGPVTWQAVPRGEGFLVTVDVAPKHAALLLDGAPLPSNPVLLRRGATHTISARADGHAPMQETVVADREKIVRLRLRSLR